MKKMDMATGSLVLLGMLVLMAGAVMKFSSLNLFDPIITAQGSFLKVANTCFLLAIIVDRFNGKA
ncbi:MAG: hypothetical protein PHT95_06315 [Candidatus Omnitrophica bacterium]|nr:hypothetical protein [Candidatus Omnitrophota bacterium]MDD4013094.1 hypothetical protein [Candidatus Omnitrophota bacterium]